MNINENENDFAHVHLSPEQTVTLKQRLSEYIVTLEKMENLRMQQKDIVDGVHQELKIDKKVFKKTASMIHKDKFKQEEGTFDACRTIYEKVYTLIFKEKQGEDNL